MNFMNSTSKMFLALALLVGSACHNQDDEIFMDPAARKSREQNNVESTRPGPYVPVPIATATYRVRVFGQSGSELCSGAVDLELMSNLGFGPANGGMVCVGQKIDFGRMLRGLSGASAPEIDVFADGLMIRVRTIGGVAFNPPRPLILGPIVQDTAPFIGLNQTNKHQATWKDPATGKLVNSTGTSVVRVIGVNERYDSSVLGKTFDRILHWEMTSTGFDGIPKSDAMIFDRIEMLWNTRPLAIPKIVIQGNVSSFLTQEPSQSNFGSGGGIFGGGSSGGGQVFGIIRDLLVGRVRIEFEATRFEGL